MRGFITRAAAVIAVLVFVSSLRINFPIYASADAMPLTVSDALKRVLDNSTQYKSYLDNDKDMQASINGILSKLGGDLSDASYMELFNQLQQLYGKHASNKLSIEMYAAKQEISILKAMAAVISAENALVLYDQTLEYERKQLMATKVKSTYNLVSEAAYSTAINNLQKKENDRVNRVAAIDAAYTTLNNLIYANTKTRYTFSLSFEYEKTENFNLTAAVSMAKDGSPELQNKQNEIDAADLALQQYIEDPDKTAEENELDLLKLENTRVLAVLAYNDTMRSIEQKVEQGYNDLQKNELQYESCLMDYEQTAKQHEINAVKYEMGNLTELDLISSANQLEQAAETLRGFTVDHAILKKQLSNPIVLL